VRSIAAKTEMGRLMRERTTADPSTQHPQAEELSITHKYARSEDVLAEEIRAQARYFSAVLV
jgi:hypothetical protein